MNDEKKINLLSILLPLFLFSALLYFTLHIIDKEDVSTKSILITILTGAVFFYLVNFRLIKASKRGNIFFLIIILVITLGAKIYILRNIKTPIQLFAGYGLLLFSVMATGIYFSVLHYNLKIFEMVLLYTDKDEYVLGESINCSIEIEPNILKRIRKLDISLVMSENTFEANSKVIDEIVYTDLLEVTLSEINNPANIRCEFVVPITGMSSYYGRNNAIFWYLKVMIYSKVSNKEIAKVIDVKPEILLRSKENE